MLSGGSRFCGSDGGGSKPSVYSQAMAEFRAEGAESALVMAEGSDNLVSTSKFARSTTSP